MPAGAATTQRGATIPTAPHDSVPHSIDRRSRWKLYATMLLALLVGTAGFVLHPWLTANECKNLGSGECWALAREVRWGSRASPAEKIRRGIIHLFHRDSDDGLLALRYHRMLVPACSHGGLQACRQYISDLTTGYGMIETDASWREAANGCRRDIVGWRIRECADAARLMYQNRVAPADSQWMFQALLGACNNGNDPEACLLASLPKFEFAHVESFRAESDDGLVARAAKLSPECARGSADACTTLAEVMNERQGNTWQPKEIVRLYEKGCNGGSQRACNNLGRMLLFGSGVDSDMSRAGELFSAACTGKLDVACQNYSLLVEILKY